MVRGQHEDGLAGLFGALCLRQELGHELVDDRVLTAATSGDRVELVDEENAWRLGAGLIEQPLHALARLPDVSRLEIRWSLQEELHAALVGERLGDLRRPT